MLHIFSPPKCYKFCRHQNVTNVIATEMLQILSPQNVTNVLSPPKCYTFCRHQDITKFVASKMLQNLSPPKCYSSTNFVASKMLQMLSPPKCYKCFVATKMLQLLSQPKCYNYCRHQNVPNPDFVFLRKRSLDHFGIRYCFCTTKQKMCLQLSLELPHAVIISNKISYHISSYFARIHILSA